jgi:hypothetical protein
MKDLYAAIVLLIPSALLIWWAIKQERQRNHRGGKGEA